MQQAIIPGFLTESDCNQIIDIARGRVERSKGWDTTTGTEHVSDYRTSEHAFIGRNESPLVLSIAQRISQITGFPIENQENIQVAHYPPGKYYKVHWDYFDPGWGASSASAFARGGNRVITFMMYLNSIPEGYGGETNFDKAGLIIRPDVGKACMWYNVFPNRAVDKSTSHEGRPPKEPYEKWIATIWIREKPFI